MIIHTFISKNDLKWLRNNKILQKIIFYIIFCLHNYLLCTFYLFIFRIIFGQTCYGTMVFIPYYLHVLCPTRSGVETKVSRQHTYLNVGCRLHDIIHTLIEWCVLFKARLHVQIVQDFLRMYYHCHG